MRLIRIQPFFLALALSVAVLAGTAQPSNAQTTTPQLQATTQTPLPSPTYYGGWHDQKMTWWPSNSGTVSTPVAPSWPASQSSAFWGCW